MHKKIIVSFFLVVLSISSFNPSIETTNSLSRLSADTNNVSMVGIDLQLQRANSNTYFSVNSSLNAPTVDVLNNTNAIFVSSFVNRDPSAVVLSWFQVNIFNSTTPSIPTHTLTKNYNTIDPTQKIIIPANSSYTESYSTILPFDKIDEVYQIQYQYQYAFQSNLSNALILNSPFNFTIHSALPPYAPPTFVIYFWWTVSGLIVIQLLIGWYGNRKMKKKSLQN